MGEKVCEACGRTVGKDVGLAYLCHATGHKGEGCVPHESTRMHEAPCGLPCMGGGVSGPVFRSGQYHDKEKCPSCGPKRS